MAKSQGSRIRVNKTYKLFIGGAFPRTESGRYTQLTNQKGEFVANVCRASRKDFRNAVVAARKAQSGWAARTAFNRGQILYRMAEMLESRRESFIERLVEISGYSKKAAEAELDVSVDRLVWYAGWADKFAQVFGSTNMVASPHFNFTFPEAMGVVAIMAPGKSPLLGLVSAVMPVIVSGSVAVTVVEDLSSPIAIEFAEVLGMSDLPGGVVNILTGLRSELLSHVAGHMDVDGIVCYGGSQDEVKKLAVEAAESVKRVTFYDDLDAAGWCEESAQSPYRILPFIEFKTAWHPIGI